MDIGKNGGYGFKGDQSVSACLVMEIEEYMVSTEPRVFLVQCHMTQSLQPQWTECGNLPNYL